MYEKGNASHGGTNSDCDGPKPSTKASGPQDDGSNSIFVRRCSFPPRMAKHKICRCGKGFCKILTSTRDQSKGRMFYCCPQSTGADNHGCGMFEWVVEEGSSSSTNVLRTDVVEPANNCPEDLPHRYSMYAKGYLEGVIRGSEQQTHALKDVLAALNKLDLNKK